MEDKEAAKNLAMNLIVALVGERRNGLNARETFKTPEYLQKLYLLMLEHIKIEEDINRAGKGVFSPGLRDGAWRTVADHPAAGRGRARRQRAVPQCATGEKDLPRLPWSPVAAVRLPPARERPWRGRGCNGR